MDRLTTTALIKLPLVKIRFSYIILNLLLLALGFQLLALPVRAAGSTSNNRDSFSRSSVAEILDSLVNATYFKDEHFSIPSKESGKFGFPSTFVPQYSDSVYAARIAALRRKTPIPLVYNEHVRGFIRLYAVDKRGSVAKILGLTKLYFPLFEEKLDEYNVPLEMKYLAIVESALNPTAVSSAGAKGLWQFMYGTGKMYGLQSSSFIEDRYDPYKASVAASRHLRDLYNIYGDWFLALAAYNSGPGNVNKAIRRAGGIKDYWAIWDYLPAETRGYVPAYIAVNYIMNYYNEHNIRPVEPGFLYQDIDTLKTTRLLSFEQINETIGIPMRDLQFLNPQYKLGIIPSAGPSSPNVIRLPRKYISQFQKREDEIYAYKSAATAERQGLYARLENLNAGTRIQSAESGSVQKGQKIHVVQQGESLGSIARMYRAYISQLIAWNNLKDAEVTPGQKLIVFGSPDTVTSSQPERVRYEETVPSVRKTIERHRVKRGETLAAIARKYNTTVQRLASLNNLSGRKKIVPGQRIKVEGEVTVNTSRSSSRKVSVARHGRSQSKAAFRKGRSSSRRVSAAKHHTVKQARPSRHAGKRRR
jgi:membrane-bound lytic murein transglycosylase D